MSPPTHSAATTSEVLAIACWETLGTGAVLQLTEAAALPQARAIVKSELHAIDLACSRFRADSELTHVNERAGARPVAIGRLLVEALEIALRAARLTDGDVDPTVGGALVLAGYDRDWRLLERPGRAACVPGERGSQPSASVQRNADAPRPLAPTWTEPAPPTVRARMRGGYGTVELDSELGTVRVPRGVKLDLGATAKAWAADRCAQAVYAALGCGVLVSLGGDIAATGPAPPEGWRIHVTDDHRADPRAPGQTIAIVSGGLATSSTVVRRWRRDGASVHHILDPATGRPACGPWRTVTVAAADCVDANIASTATLVRGDAGPTWLARVGLPARLVDHRDRVLRLGGWPEHRKRERPARGHRYRIGKDGSAPV
jgi:thiamine biosynthesis lipoprotein